MFTAMPLSTFLPANLDARKHHESESVATRSVAWIAADDALDAIDGADDQWTPGTRRLVCARVAHARAALQACSELSSSLTRMSALCDLLQELELALRRHDGAATWNDVDALDSTKRIRHMWETWGPVPRLPTIADRLLRPDDRTEPKVKLHPKDFEGASATRWRSL